MSQGTRTDSYRGSTYTGDKKDARGCKSYGLALKRRNSTLRHTSCTCRAKFTIRLDHNSFFMVCGIGENQHTGHPPLRANKIKNRKRFLDDSTLETVAADTKGNAANAGYRKKLHLMLLSLKATQTWKENAISPCEWWRSFETKVISFY